MGMVAKIIWDDDFDTVSVEKERSEELELEGAESDDNDEEADDASSTNSLPLSHLNTIPKPPPPLSHPLPKHIVFLLHRRHIDIIVDLAHFALSELEADERSSRLDLRFMVVSNEGEEDLSRLASVKKEWKCTHSEGVTDSHGRRLRIGWAEWMPRKEGGGEMLFGLPFEEEGWLSEKWMEENGLQ